MSQNTVSETSVTEQGTGKAPQQPSSAETHRADNVSRRRLPFRSSYVVALLFTGVIAAWMLSGEIIIGGQSSAESTNPTSKSTVGTTLDTATDKASAKKPLQLFRVQARSFAAKSRKATLRIRARSEPEMRVQVRAETTGIVQTVAVEKGQAVKKGDLLCRIETAARAATLAQAKAQLAQVAADYAATKRLLKRGHTPKLKLTSDKAKLDAARAAIKIAELDLERTNITAPFSGIVEGQPAEVGSYLSIGTSCATLIALDPLIISGNVSERDVGGLHVGMPGRASLITGGAAQGKIRYIAPAADPATRTFRVELEVPNTKHTLRAGVTATIDIPLKSKPGHQLSAGILTLNDAGKVGVRVVENKHVRFIPVKVVAQSHKGVWVTGLPDKVSVITVGQDYVVDGQEVELVEPTSKNKPDTESGKGPLGNKERTGDEHS